MHNFSFKNLLIFNINKIKQISKNWIYIIKIKIKTRGKYKFSIRWPSVEYTTKSKNITQIIIIIANLLHIII